MFSSAAAAAVCGDLLWKYHPDLSQQNNSPPCGEEPGLSLWVRYWGRRMFVCCLYYRALKLESVNVSFASAKTRVKSLSVAKWAYILSSSGSLFSSLFMSCFTFHALALQIQTSLTLSRSNLSDGLQHAAPVLQGALHSWASSFTWPLVTSAPCDTINYPLFWEGKDITEKSRVW